MLELIYQGLVSSLRSCSVKIMLAFITILLGIALLAASFSGRQPLVIALDIGFTGLHLISLLMALFLIQELFSRDIERKTLYFVLAYPITRYQYLLARFLSAVLLSLFAIVIIGGLLWLAIYYFDTGYQQSDLPVLDIRFSLALLGIWLDLVVVMAFSIFVATFSLTPFLPMLLGLAFALAARGLGPTLDYLRHNPYADPTQTTLLLPILDIVQLILPDLSRLDWRTWTLYDQPIQWIDILGGSLMALAYISLALLLAGRILEQRDLT